MSSRIFFGAFAAIFDLENAGGFEFVDVFHDELGDVEFEAGAFQAEAFHADFLFAQADDEADDFAVEAGRDFVLGDDLRGAVDERCQLRLCRHLDGAVSWGGALISLGMKLTRMAAMMPRPVSTTRRKA